MSESSSEDENTERLKEAVWSFGPKDAKINGKDGDNSRQSHRADVSKHEHDGNELGTTPEFRSHVAKKLGAFLDGCISEVFSKAVESGQSENRNEEGFRLFSTSAPGNWMEQSPPQPPKRRPIPSSSDSDSEMEMRLREAAVSVSDILGPAAQHLTEKTTTTVESETEEDTVTKKKKKKKKRKTSIVESEEKNGHVSEKQSNGEGPEEQTAVEESLTKKKKKKKRKKLEEGTKDGDE